MEIGDNTEADKESWEGLGDEDEGVAKDEVDDGEGEKGMEEGIDADEGEKTGDDLVSAIFFLTSSFVNGFW